MSFLAFIYRPSPLSLRVARLGTSAPPAGVRPASTPVLSAATVALLPSLIRLFSRGVLRFPPYHACVCVCVQTYRSADGAPNYAECGAGGRGSEYEDADPSYAEWSGAAREDYEDADPHYEEGANQNYGGARPTGVVTLYEVPFADDEDDDIYGGGQAHSQEGCVLESRGGGGRDRTRGAAESTLNNVVYSAQPQGNRRTRAPAESTLNNAVYAPQAAPQADYATSQAGVVPRAEGQRAKATTMWNDVYSVPQSGRSLVRRAAAHSSNHPSFGTSPWLPVCLHSPGRSENGTPLNSPPCLFAACLSLSRFCHPGARRPSIVVGQAVYGQVATFDQQPVYRLPSRLPSTTHVVDDVYTVPLEGADADADYSVPDAGVVDYSAPITMGVGSGDGGDAVYAAAAAGGSGSGSIQRVPGSAPVSPHFSCFVPLKSIVP